MSQQRVEGVYPANVHFAFRLLNCLIKVCGPLSSQEFTDWFSFPKAGRAQRRFKRIVFRVYLKTHLKKSLLKRLKKGPFLVRIRIIRRVRKVLCTAWRAPSVYALYREVLLKGFDFKAFAQWWDELRPVEQQLFVYAWANQITVCTKAFWLDRTGEDPVIYVRMSGGDSNSLLTF